MAVYDVFAWTPLFLADLVTLNIHVLSVEDQLVLNDAVQSNQSVQSVSQLLEITDSVKVSKTVAVHAANSLALVQDGQRTPINVAVVDYLDMYQSSQTHNQWPDVKQTLVLSDVAVCESAIGVYDTLVLSQSVQVQKTVALQAANTLTVISKATVYKPDQFWTSYDVVVVNP